jgi:hypothetical protein
MPGSERSHFAILLVIKPTCKNAFVERALVALHFWHEDVKFKLCCHQQLRHLPLSPHPPHIPIIAAIVGADTQAYCRYVVRGHIAHQSFCQLVCVVLDPILCTRTSPPTAGDPPASDFVRRWHFNPLSGYQWLGFTRGCWCSYTYCLFVCFYFWYGEIL